MGNNQENKKDWTGNLREYLSDVEIYPDDSSWPKLEKELKGKKNSERFLLAVSFAAAVVIAFIMFFPDKTEKKGSSEISFYNVIQEKQETVVSQSAPCPYNDRKIEEGKIVLKKKKKIKSQNNERLLKVSLNPGEEPENKIEKENNARDFKKRDSRNIDDTDRRTGRRENDAAYELLKKNNKIRFGLIASAGFSQKQEDNYNYEAFTFAVGTSYGVEKFRTGSPYKYHHDLPLKFGFSVQYKTTNYIYVESGLVYTILHSDVKDLYTNKSFDQYYYYLGIPLKLNVTYFKTSGLSLYLFPGVQADKAIYGKKGGKKDIPGKIRFSVFGGTGVQYKIYKKLFVFGEIHFSHYFKINDKRETYWDKHRNNITFNYGLRLSY